jgi:NAD-dependent SIR2 family protein deacetylase
MLHLNHDLMHTYLDEGPRSLRPDGDVVLNEDVYRRFVTPGCSTCNGTLKPGVIFFGGTVPPEVAQASYDVIDQHDALLVRGLTIAYSSLEHRISFVFRPVACLISCNAPISGSRY